MRELIFQRKAVRKLVEYTWCLEQRVITLLNLPCVFFVIHLS